MRNALMTLLELAPEHWLAQGGINACCGMMLHCIRKERTVQHRQSLYGHCCLGTTNPSPWRMTRCLPWPAIFQQHSRIHIRSLFWEKIAGANENSVPV